MFRKLAVALLLTAILFEAGVGTALADSSAIQKGDNNDNVLLLQLRLQDLGYYDYLVTGFFGDFTVKALKDFQTANGLTVDGKAGQKTLDTLYGQDAKPKTIKPIDQPKPSTAGKTTKKTATARYGSYVDWESVNKIWKIGMNCKVIDFDTRITYTVKRVNESYSVGHADVAPISKADTAALKRTFGGSFNAYRRALVVNIGGKWYAASLYGEPHGSTGVPGNGMNLPDGTLQQVCIHFKGSWTNCHGMIDPAHQWQIKRAAHIKPTGSRPTLVYPGD